MPEIQFLGATGTVTGSKYLVRNGEESVLVDCGLFQGLKEHRLRNWHPVVEKPDRIDHVIVTHAHIDHSGHLPRLVAEGYHNSIHCSRGTARLLDIMLLDSAHLQEEDAKFANKKGFTRHSPAEPLYTVEHAKKTLELVRAEPIQRAIKISGSIKVEFHRAGHILGANSVVLEVATEGRPVRICFSGDIGRYNVPILQDPEPGSEVDYLVVESTYGDRLHNRNDLSEELVEVVNKSLERKGVLLIPSFAVGRTQHLLYLLREIEAQNRIPSLPIFVDSPMAIDVTEVYEEFSSEYDADAKRILAKGHSPLMPVRCRFTNSVEQSKMLNSIPHSAIIISASGMATGGRILHHLARRLPAKQHTIAFIGYQAFGTRGRTILDGAEAVKMHGHYYPIRAHIETIEGFSAHADYKEILRWLKTFPKAPKTVFITHGEPQASVALGQHIQKELGWNVLVPNYLESFTLGDGDL